LNAAISFALAARELPMFAQGEEPFSILIGLTAMGECGSGFEQFLARTGKKRIVSKNRSSQGLPSSKPIRRAPTVPHLESPSTSW